MAGLSQDDRIVITQYPLNDSLDLLRKELQEADQSYSPSSTPNKGAGDRLKAVSKLFSTLQTHDVAFTLRPKTGNENLASELSKLFRQVQNNNFDYQQYRPLSLLVIRKAPDLDIWNAIFDLIRPISRLTPPTSIAPRSSGTPRRYTSASQQGSEQTKQQVERPLRVELADCCYVKVGGFFEKYFLGKSWSKRSQMIVESVGNNLDFPRLPTQDAVWDWLSLFQETKLCSDDVRGVYYTTHSKKDLTGSKAERQLDIFIKSRDASSSGQHHWSDVRVIGEHKQSADRAGKFLQLARYARDVFSAQPTRILVHGFLLLGTTMELHVFDRSGAFSAAEFDILKEPERFVRVLAGYVLMSDEEVGMDTFVKREGKRKYVTFTDDDSQEERQLTLETDPIVIQRAIACRGTCCYRTVDSKYVVKFSWQPEKRTSEVEHLRAAHKIKGVARLVGYRRITSVAEIRRGLVFQTKRKIYHSQDRTRSSSSQSQIRSLSSGVNTIRRQLDKEAECLSRKKLRSNSQTSRLSLEYHGGDGNGDDDLPAPLASSVDPNEMFKNLVLNCLAVAPVGRPLASFENVSELLQALQDAVKAHRSLYQDAQILHRDISENNIVITNPNEADGFSGMLIDMDMATRIDKEGKNEGTGARQLTGTLEFMAIEVLETASSHTSIDHTYRHDLESLFYVLISSCVRYGWKNDKPPKDYALRGWYTGHVKDIARAKRGDMHVDGFEKYVLTAFSPTFERVKDLARNLRDILFGKGGLYISTPKDPDLFYSAIIKEFDAVIDRLGHQEPENLPR